MQEIYSITDRDLLHSCNDEMTEDQLSKFSAMETSRLIQLFCKENSFIVMHHEPLSKSSNLLPPASCSIGEINTLKGIPVHLFESIKEVSTALVELVLIEHERYHIYLFADSLSLKNRHFICFENLCRLIAFHGVIILEIKH